MVAAVRPTALNFPDATISKVAGPVPGNAPMISEPTGGSDFTKQLREVLSETNEQQASAHRAADEYARGNQNDLHGTMIAMTEADIKLRLVTQVRNKVLEAYREVMRMGS